MTSSSIAFATDLVARVAEGGTVERADGYRVIRTPANPAFRWGNFLLVDADADLGDPERWALRHRRAFPDLDFVTVGVDAAGAEIEEAAWRASGFEVERSVVLRASARELRREDEEVDEIAGDAGWAGVLAVWLAEGSDEPGFEAFERIRVAAERSAVEAGRAAWLGIRDEAGIVSTLGVLPVPGGVGRYQNVGTLAPYRRRGLAGRLLRAGAALAATRWGCTELVIVADADGPAIGLYRRLGFRDAETQLQLTRLGRS